MSPDERPRTGIGARAETSLRVRYAETDAMGIAHHAEYLAWFEVGRTEWIRAVGAPDARGPRSYRRLEAGGFMLPVVELTVRYLASARYDDDVVVRVILADASRVRLSFDYEIMRPADDALLVRGRSEHVVTDRSGKPRRLPPDVLAWLLGNDGVAPEDAVTK